jgi:tetratricopeptide (TPR) repeat protein/GR25 family glycosyltransferase involved in LPS biosynthesis
VAAVQIHYLNLARRPDRNERFLRANAGLADLQRVEAVDGRGLRLEELTRGGFVAGPLPAYTPGALGGALSHRALWERCAARGTPLTVAEDDAVLNRSFADRAARLLGRLPPDWDIVLWGWNCDSVLEVEVIEGAHRALMQFSPWSLGPRVAAFRESDYEIVPLRLLTAFGIMAYSVSPAGARRLHARCFPLRDEPLAVPGLVRQVTHATLDVAMNRHYRDLRAYVCFPPLAWTENDRAASDVAGAAAMPNFVAMRKDVCRHRAGDEAAAERPCREVPQAVSDRAGRADGAEAHHARALADAARGDSPAAAEGLRQALRLRPDYAEAHHNLGVTLARLGRPDEALDAFRRAVRCRPDYAAALARLAPALAERGRAGEAADAYRRLLRLRPDDAAAHNALGLLLARQGRPAEAAEAFRRAVDLDAGPAAHHHNLGAALAEQGRPDEALACFEQALRRQPDHAEAHKARAMAWLLQGDFARGWEEYEWRWRCADFSPRAYCTPPWDGGPLDGRTILLHAEQGLGDTLQFVRYAPLLRRRGAAVLVACPPPLVPLLRTCPGVTRVVAQGSPLPEFDCHAPLLSLPRLLGTTPASVPADVPYLAADPELTARWQRELAGVRGLKVGVVWQGSPGNGADRRRSFPLARLAPLVAVPGVELFSLQKGRGAEQLAEATGRFRVTDLGSRLDLSGGAFTGTAAALRALDLLVTCDTACAHLAGALGVRAWVALSYAADWRWLLGRDDSPWYPTERLFRQPALGDWDAVFARMAAELRRLVASGEGR